MRRGERARRGRDGGFTYLGLLTLVALIGILLAAAGEVAATAARREREAQLLWVGHEYRAAIGRYWNRTRRYPEKLEELLGSAPDAPAPVHFLRQLYRDPMTNAVDWVLVPAPSGGFMGIASSSKRAPLKTGGFDPDDHDFEQATTYGDWQFTFLPALRRGVPYQAPAPPRPQAAPATHPTTPTPPPRQRPATSSR
jgi:type II secretory pathway pseudopilin PulG